MAGTEVWLELGAEYGGEAFGPLDAPETTLGTSEDADIQLGQGLGVTPRHARLVRKSPDTFYLSAVDRDGEVWVRKAGGGKPAPLHGPVVVRVGDAFSLGGPNGVRFELVARAPKGAKAAAATAGVDGGRYAKGVAAEIGRRVQASALGTWWGTLLDNGARFVKQRQFLAPGYLVALALMVSGWGFGALRWREVAGVRADADDAARRAEACATELEAARSTKAGAADLGELARRITGDTTAGEALAWAALLDGARGRLPALFDERKEALRLGWIDGDRSPWARAAAALKDAGLPPTLSSGLAWITVEPDVAVPGAGPRWAVSGTGACLRGPFRLSYAQGLALGLDVVPDAFLDDRATGGLGGDDTRARLIEALRGTETAATRAEATIGEDAAIGPGNPVRGGLCYALVDPDDRDDARKVASALAAKLGPKAPKLPDPALGGATAARVARLLALRLPPDDVEKLDLSDGRHLDAGFPSAAAAGEVAEAVSEPLAASLALPCALLLSRGPDAFPRDLPAPDFDACAILRARATTGRW